MSHYQVFADKSASFLKTMAAVIIYEQSNHMMVFGIALHLRKPATTFSWLGITQISLATGSCYGVAKASLFPKECASVHTCGQTTKRQSAIN